MSDSQGSETPRGAATVFVDYVVRVSLGEDVDFDAFCAEHAEHEAELRRMRAACTIQESSEKEEAPRTSDEEFTSAVLGRLSGRTGFQRYHQKDEIARGGMGRIVQVWDEDLRRNIAMKFLLTRNEDDPQQVDTRALSFFLEEAQVTAQLDHPGIVPVHEVGVDPEGHTYFTMKLVKGQELHEIIELARADAEGWTITRVLGLLQRVCETLAYAHDKGVVHRDVKPANVMVGRFGEALVMDWGLAKVLGEKEREERLVAAADAASGSGAESLLDPERPSHDTGGAIVGTPSYMPPEQALGEPVDERSDVYAVGAMLYQLLTGRRPYVQPGERLTGVEVLYRVIDGPPESVHSLDPSVSEELQAICERAMAREPGRRYPSALSMADDLRAYLEGRVVQAHRTGAWMEFKKWVARNRRFAGALAAVFLAIVSGVGATGYVEARGRKKAEAERDRTQTAYDVRVLRDLDQAEASGSFWPPLPDRRAFLQEWIDTTSAIDERMPEYLTRLEELNAKADVLAAEASEDEPAPETKEQALLGGLTGAREELPQRIAEIRALAEFADSLEELTRTGVEAQRRWSEASADIASRHAGLALEPQLGLLPLRRDPDSNLWEFWHVLSGEEPLVSDEGKYELTAETGIVLVLVPGGQAMIGTTAEREGLDSNGMLFFQVDEGPPQDVQLDPFFIAKYELTAAQWEGVMNTAPSQRAETPLHPVDTVSWSECREAVRRLALQLPTEAQWEYACRANQSTPWTTGADAATLKGSANLADESYHKSGFAPQHPYLEGVDDGFALAAPVGSLLPNGFGLHDVHGNVWEWCRDAYQRSGGMRAGDGLRGPGVLPSLVGGTFRGGSWMGDESNVRSANRYAWGRSATEPDVGLRPIRRIDG